MTIEEIKNSLSIVGDKKPFYNKAIHAEWQKLFDYYYTLHGHPERAGRAIHCIGCYFPVKSFFLQLIAKECLKKE